MVVYVKFKDLCLSVDRYPAFSELMYKYGFTKSDIEANNRLKRTDVDYVKTGLVGEQGEPVLYWNRPDILMRFTGSHNLIKGSTLNEYADFRDSEPLNGFIFSEIESSLSIEGVRSTRARIEQVSRIAYDDLIEENDIIVKNMLLGYDFVRKNDITEETVHKLYRILSNRCLKPDNELPKDARYRNDEVQIVDAANAVVDRGVSWRQIPELMGGLMDYVHREKSYEEHLAASHVIHFYFVYVHPYFDFNGRMARMMSLWYNRRNAPSLSLLLASEAINNKIHKNGYYAAIAHSREMGNDLTYFLEYMSHIVLDYTKVYINFYSLLKKLKAGGVIPSRSTELALKQVLAMPAARTGFFDWKDYRDATREEVSKVQYLNNLNRLVDMGILSTEERKKAKLFTLNRAKWDLL